MYLSWVPLAQMFQDALKLLAGAAVSSEGSTHSGRVCFQARSLTTRASPQDCQVHGSWIPPASVIQEKERGSKHPTQKAQSFHNPISEAMSHYFCHILFVRSKSIGSAHAQRKGITQAHKHEGAGILAAIFQANYHTKSFRCSERCLHSPSLKRPKGPGYS